MGKVDGTYNASLPDLNGGPGPSRNNRHVRFTFLDLRCVLLEAHVTS